MEDRRYRIYISGPIEDGDAGERRKRFNDLADQLRDLGYEACSPFDFLKDILHDEWGDDVIQCLRQLQNCDALIQIKGWQHDMWCHTEMDYAIGIGLPILKDYDLRSVPQLEWMMKQIEEYAQRRNQQ